MNNTMNNLTNAIQEYKKRSISASPVSASKGKMVVSTPPTSNVKPVMDLLKPMSKMKKGKQSITTSHTLPIAVNLVDNTLTPTGTADSFEISRQGPKELDLETMKKFLTTSLGLCNQTLPPNQLQPETIDILAYPKIVPLSPTGFSVNRYEPSLKENQSSKTDYPSSIPDYSHYLSEHPSPYPTDILKIGCSSVNNSRLQETPSKPKRKLEHTQQKAIKRVKFDTSERSISTSGSGSTHNATAETNASYQQELVTPKIPTQYPEIQAYGYIPGNEQFEKQIAQNYSSQGKRKVIKNYTSLNYEEWINSGESLLAKQTQLMKQMALVRHKYNHKIHCITDLINVHAQELRKADGKLHEKMKKLQLLSQEILNTF